jgi:hypothetical protein
MSISGGAALVFRNDYADLVDSLPYLDEKLTVQEMEKVRATIQEFKKTFLKKDYLKDVPLPKMMCTDEVALAKSGKRTILSFKSAELIVTLQDK